MSQTASLVDTTLVSIVFCRHFKFNLLTYIAVWFLPLSIDPIIRRTVQLNCRYFIYIYKNHYTLSAHPTREKSIHCNTNWTKNFTPIQLLIRWLGLVTSRKHGSPTNDFRHGCRKKGKTSSMAHCKVCNKDIDISTVENRFSQPFKRD